MIEQAMIFSAGLGTRFKPWTDHHPKALALVNGKPLLQRNIEYLQKYGIFKVVVNVHHFADQVINEIEKNKGWGSEIIISDERNLLLETGGGLLHARKFFESNPFITLNVDVLTRLDISAIQKHHEESRALITLSVQERKTSRYFLFDSEMRLCGWRNVSTGEEKIVRDTGPFIQKAYSCVGVYDPSIFDLVPQQGKFSLTETFLSLAPNHLINGFLHGEDDFVDVGKPESVEVAERKYS